MNRKKKLNNPLGLRFGRRILLIGVGLNHYMRKTHRKNKKRFKRAIKCFICNSPCPYEIDGETYICDTCIEKEGWITVK